jgi:uncharacterized protein (TIGR03066 family)
LTRAIPGCVFALLTFCSTATAEDRKKEKFDAAKLVGRWGPKDKKDGTYTIEYRADGTVVLVGTADGREWRWEGTYKLEGSRLSAVLRSEIGEWSGVNTLTKLTGAELTGKNSSGNPFSLIRLKEK